MLVRATFFQTESSRETKIYQSILGRALISLMNKFELTNSVTEKSTQFETNQSQLSQAVARLDLANQMQSRCISSERENPFGLEDRSGQNRFKPVAKPV